MSLISVAFLISAISIIASVGQNLEALNPALLPVKNLLSLENLQPKPYQFGYEIADGLGMNQHRREVADGSGTVKGSYGYIDHLGVNRIVEYTADKDGYNAVVKSNEPGMAAQSSANALFIVQAPPQAAIDQGLKPLVLNNV